MAKQIRIGIFETNSSSTHSISICTEAEWLALKENSTEELSEDIIENYDDYINGDLETYCKQYTTPGGEKLVIFGSYGYNG
jgi:hypothetical protein